MSDAMDMSLEAIAAAKKTESKPKPAKKEKGAGGRGGGKGRGRGSLLAAGRGGGAKGKSQGSFIARGRGGGKAGGGRGGAQRRERTFNNARQNASPYGGGNMRIRRTVRLDDEDDFDEFDEEDYYEEEVEEVPRHREGLSTGTTVQVSNLDHEVTEEDIEELFSSPIGDSKTSVALKSAVVNYNREGKSNGTATIVFARRSDAANAINEYHGVPLDGKPMQLAMVMPLLLTHIFSFVQ